MSLLEIAKQYKRGETNPGSPRDTPSESDREYCKHNEEAAACAYCAANELGEHLRPLRERAAREKAIAEEKAEAKRLGKKWTKPKPPRSPVKRGQVCPQWGDNTEKESIRKLTLKTLYEHSERVIAAKRNISLSNGVEALRGTRGHLISVMALESALDPFRAILQQSLDKGCVMVVLNDFFMVIPEDWVRYPKR